MALVKCPECSHEVSDKASACPSCGCPMPITAPTPSAALKPVAQPSPDACVFDLNGPKVAWLLRPKGALSGKKGVGHLQICCGDIEIEGALAQRATVGSVREIIQVQFVDKNRTTAVLKFKDESLLRLQEKIPGELDPFLRRFDEKAGVPGLVSFVVDDKVARQYKNEQAVLGFFVLVAATLVSVVLSPLVFLHSRDNPEFGHFLIAFSIAWLSAIALGLPKSFRRRLTIVRFAYEYKLISPVPFVVLIATIFGIFDEDGELARRKYQADKAQREQKALAVKALASTETFMNELNAIEVLFANSKYKEAQDRFDSLFSKMTPYTRLKPMPAKIAQVISSRDDLAKRMKDVTEVLTAIRDLETCGERIKSIAREPGTPPWDRLRETCQNALDQVAKLETVVDKKLRRLIPDNLDLKKELASIEERIGWLDRERILVESARSAAAEKEEAQRPPCGQQPMCQTFDRGCAIIEVALQRTAHDPSSIDVENCTKPRLTEDTCWVTTCDVRGKNTLGAMVLQRRTFSVSTRGVSEL